MFVISINALAAESLRNAVLFISKSDVAKSAYALNGDYIDLCARVIREQQGVR